MFSANLVKQLSDTLAGFQKTKVKLENLKTACADEVKGANASKVQLKEMYETGLDKQQQRITVSDSVNKTVEQSLKHINGILGLSDGTDQ